MRNLILYLILITLLMIAYQLNVIIDERISRVTKIEHKTTYHIKHFYGDLTFKEKTNVHTPSINRSDTGTSSRAE